VTAVRDEGGNGFMNNIEVVKQEKPDFAQSLETPDNQFTMKIGSTTYEVTTHFNADGKQSVLQQFRDLILSNHLI
jgi:hypothetical protein